MITDDELRERLGRFYSSGSVPPITESTRPLLLTKLSNLEEQQPTCSATTDVAMHDQKTDMSPSPNKVEDDEDKLMNEVEVVVKNPRKSDNPKPDHNNGIIQTLVFFDLEATGLKSTVLKPKITELAMVAVSADDFLRYRSQLGKKICEGGRSEVDSCRPRVLNKMTLCFNPQSMVPPEVTDMTGLDNYNLETHAAFDTGASGVIQGFLSRLPKPVCLVAHNGNSYDFQLLNSELGEDMSIPTIDSLIALRRIFKESSSNVNATGVTSLTDGGSANQNSPASKRARISNSQSVEEAEVSSSTAPVPSASVRVAVADLNDSPDLFDEGDELSISVPSAPPSPRPPLPEDDDEVGGGGDVTPVGSKTMPRNPPVAAKNAGGANGRPSNKQVPKSCDEYYKKKQQTTAVKKRLDFDASVVADPQMPPSFSLPKLHQYVFGSTPRVSHGAEEDCMALMRVCAFKAQDFLRFVNQNNVCLSSLPKMWQ